ncbi:CHRD domain-containing protein [Halobacillus sp. A5]|uniref:CHRD domain-containing protein n=1 Tax=Halobacillus sp. A5 TaxID=2880263 RepID=UPI0020A6AA50|nr:CHRD domain-containing protein [Halobacillus sp. A5]MCP3027804.1 CHRD domain-containing protein [Halobacillus sp. A5]
MDKFIAKLKGENEVPHPVDTKAVGIAKFLANHDCTKIKFELEVCDIKNFVQAHIHFGARGENGPVLVFLFGADLETLGDQHGISTCGGVVRGVITDEDIVKNKVRIRCVSDLIECMKEEMTYVNAHTEQNPDGEIRGQIVPFHHKY